MRMSMDTVEGFFNVYEVNVQSSLPFSARFSDVSRGKYMSNASSSTSK